MAYTFGKNITFPFYPRDADGEVISPSVDNPSIFVFSEQPSREEAAAGSGSYVVGSEITSWSNSGNAYNITIPAIADPEPNSTEHTRIYYLGVNYTIETGGNTVTNILSFKVSRALGYDNELSVTAADLEVYFNKVDSYNSDSEQNSLVNESIERVKADLRAKGYEWARIHRIERLRLCVIDKTIYFIALSQIADDEDFGFRTMMDEAKDNYRSSLEELRLEYDKNQDGVEDSEANPANYTFQQA